MASGSPRRRTSPRSGRWTVAHRRPARRRRTASCARERIARRRRGLRLSSASVTNGFSSPGRIRHVAGGAGGARRLGQLPSARFLLNVGPLGRGSYAAADRVERGAAIGRVVPVADVALLARPSGEGSSAQRRLPRHGCRAAGCAEASRRTLHRRRCRRAGRIRRGSENHARSRTFWCHREPMGRHAGRRAKAAAVPVDRNRAAGRVRAQVALAASDLRCNSTDRPAHCPSATASGPCRGGRGLVVPSAMAVAVALGSWAS